MYASFAVCIYISVSYVPWGETVASWCVPVFRFNMYYPVFPKWLYQFIYSSVVNESSICPTYSVTFAWYCFIYLAILVGVKWYCIVDKLVFQNKHDSFPHSYPRTPPTCTPRKSGIETHVYFYKTHQMILAVSWKDAEYKTNLSIIYCHENDSFTVEFTDFLTDGAFLPNYC